MLEFILETERLILREFAVADAEGFFAMNNDPVVLQYTGDSPFASVAEAAVFITHYDHYQRHGFGRWTVRRKHDNTYLGFCGLKYHPESDEVDLGYRLARAHWGQGYATEAARACLAYGLKQLQLPRIIGRVHQDNYASIRILEKTGMTFDRYFDFDGRPGKLYSTNARNC